jgi:hypothetical protein
LVTATGMCRACITVSWASPVGARDRSRSNWAS